MSAEHPNQKYCPGYTVIRFGIGSFLNENRDGIAAFGAAISAVATVFIALFTSRLWSTSKGQFKVLSDSVEVARRTARAALDTASATEEQSRLSRMAFTRLERPYILMSGVSKFEVNAGVVGGIDPRLYYTVGNYGKTPAIIEDVQVLFSVGDEPETPLRADESNPLFLNRILSPSEVRERLFEVVPYYVPIPDMSDPRPRLPQGSDLFFWIRILYRGPFTRDHATSACFIWYIPENCFIRYGPSDSEYNYIQ